MRRGSCVVLVVDDQVLVGTTLRRMIASEPDVALHVCHEPRAALDTARRVAPTVILQDLVMPEIDGLTLLGAYRSERDLRDVPVIILSSNEDARDKEESFSRGANDYLVKLPDRVELLARIRFQSRMLALQREREATLSELSRLRRELEEKNLLLETLAVRDPLTGMANRRRFDEALLAEWRRCTRERSPLSIALVDVDHFKRFNDRLGHPAGDECLRVVGDTVATAAHRATDVAARWGGEEFALLLPATPAPGALKVAEQTRASLHTRGLLHPDSPTARCVTVSIGVATGTPCQRISPDALVAAADAALYDAKHAGRDRVVVRVLATE